MKKRTITVIVTLATLATLLAGCGSKAVEAAKPAPIISRQITVPLGTTVTIRTSTTLSTRDTRAGETVQVALEAPLVVAGETLAPRGAVATLLVADSNPGGRVKGRAQIGLRLVSVQVAGVATPLATNIAWHQARATKGKDAAKIGIMSGIGAAIGAIGGGGKGAAIGAGAGGGAGTALVLSTHGDAAVVPAESVLRFQLAQPLIVTVTG